MRAHVSGVVCLGPPCEPAASGAEPARSTCGAGAAVDRAPTVARSATSHARRPRFQLHSRPPRQRLPSSLVIESDSALASAPVRPSRAESLPMNASDYSLSIRSFVDAVASHSGRATQSRSMLRRCPVPCPPRPLQPVPHVSGGAPWLGDARGAVGRRGRHLQSSVSSTKPWKPSFE